MKRPVIHTLYSPLEMVSVSIQCSLSLTRTQQGTWKLLAVFEKLKTPIPAVLPSPKYIDHFFLTRQLLKNSVLWGTVLDSSIYVVLCGSVMQFYNYLGSIFTTEIQFSKLQHKVLFLTLKCYLAIKMKTSVSNSQKQHTAGLKEHHIIVFIHQWI